MYMLNIRDLYAVAVCLLVINVLYIVVFGVTFPTVCTALTLLALILAYIYCESGSEILFQCTSLFGLPPPDGHLVDLQSSSTNVVDPWSSSHISGAPVTSPRGSRNPGTLSNDRAGVCDSSSPGQPRQRHNTTGRNDGTGVVPNATDSTLNGAVGPRFDDLQSRHNREQIRSQASTSIPVQATRGEHSNRSFPGETATANAFLGHDSHPQSAVGVRGYNPNSLSLSPDPQFPSSGSKNTTPELFPYAGQISRSTANEIVSHPTHQLQYGSLGVLPLVHLSEVPHTISNVYGNRCLGHGPVADFRIAPPDPLIAPVQFIHPESMPPSAQNSTSCVADALHTLTEKRSRSTQYGEVMETGVAYQQLSNKRRRLDNSVESASPCSPPIVASGSGGLSLKRPALADIRDEVVASKQSRIQPSVVPSFTSQPGASARNPIDASFTSSIRWLKRRGLPVDNSRNSLNLSNSTTNKDRPPSQVDVSVQLQGTSDVGQVQLTSYKVHVTNEDVEEDRQKEMKRARYMLGEDSDLIHDAEVGLSAPCAVSSSATLCASSPQVAASDLQLSSGLLSVADSVSPADEPMSICTVAPSVQQLHTSAVTTVVYSTPSLAVSSQLALRYDPTSSLGSSFGHLPVLSTANPNPPASFNFQSTVSQSAASSVIPTSDPPITTFTSPVFSTGSTQAAGSSGGFRFDSLASNKTSSSSDLATNPTSLSNTVGGFKFVPSKKSVSAGVSLQFPQCVTTSEKLVSEIASTATLAAVFGFGQTSGVPALSFSQPHTTVVTSTAIASQKNADSSVIQVSASISANTGIAVPYPPVFTTDSKFMHDQSLAINRTSSSSFHSNISRSEASAGLQIPSNTMTCFSGMFGSSTVSSSSASMSAVEDRSNSALNSAAPSSCASAVPLAKPFDGNPVTGMLFNSKGFFPSANTNNQSLAVNAFDRQNPNSVYESQQNSANNAGNQPMREQSFGAGTTSAFQFGAQPAFGSFVNNQPAQPVSFCNQQAVTNSFSLQPTTAMAFNNQYSSVNPVVSTPVPSLNSLSNSNAPLFSFTSQNSVSFTTEASVFSVSNPTTTISISKASLPAFPFGNPGSTISISKASAPTFFYGNPTSTNSETSCSNSSSLNLFGSQPQAGGQFAKQVNSASGFGGLPPHSDVSGNQQLAFSNSSNFGTPTTLGNALGQFASSNSFNFGTPLTLGNAFGQFTSSNSFNFSTPPTLVNAFDGQTKSASPFEKSSTGTNIFGNHAFGHVTQASGFGSYAGISAATCVVGPTAHFSNPQFTQAPFSFSSVHSGDQNNSSVLSSSAFQFPQNVATTSVVTSAQPPASPNPFSSDTSFSQFQSNSQAMNFAQFPTPSNPFSTTQSPFASQTPWTPPKFNIGTDGTDPNAAKNRSATKIKPRRKP